VHQFSLLFSEFKVFVKASLYFPIFLSGPIFLRARAYVSLTVLNQSMILIKIHCRNFTLFAHGLFCGS